MLGLEYIEAYLPEKEEFISNLSETLEIDKFQLKLLTRFHGLERVRYNQNQSLKELLIKPLENLLTKIDKHQVKYILYAHTITTVAPYPINILEDLKNDYGLKHAVSFSITHHHCSSALTAIEVAKYLIKDKNEKVLLITGEKPFTPKAQLIPNTTVMGEGSSCSLISKDSKDNKILSTDRIVLGEYYSGLNLSPELSKEFEKEYTQSLIKTIKGAINKAGLDIDEISYIIPHNVNRSSWLKVIEEMQLHREKIFLDNVPEIGHCYCSDPFLNYNAMAERGYIKKGDYYILVTVGLGATFSAAVLQH